MRAKRRTNAERDAMHRIVERRALKLMRLGVGTPEDQRRWARDAGLPVAELRKRSEDAAKSSRHATSGATKT
jgi:hypothetical protein